MSGRAASHVKAQHAEAAEAVEALGLVELVEPWLLKVGECPFVACMPVAADQVGQDTGMCSKSASASEGPRGNPAAPETTLGLQELWFLQL